MKIFNNKKVALGIYILICLGILALLIIPFIFAGLDKSTYLIERNWFGPIFYSFCLLASLVVIVVYLIFQKKKNFWILLTFISVSTAMVGYLGVSFSNEITKALLANRIAYFGNVFLLPFLIMTSANICQIKFKKSFIAIMFSISLVMFAFAVSQGHLNIFYESESFTFVNGFARIDKVYGPMHLAYVIYIVVYALFLLGLVIFSYFKNKIPSKICATIFLILVFINVVIWLIERWLPYTVEYTAVTFIVTEFVLLYIYKYLEKKGSFDQYRITFSIQDENNHKTDSSQQMIITLDNSSFSSISSSNGKPNIILLNENEIKDKLHPFFESNNLTAREEEIVYLIIKGHKRKQIAKELFISEETVKTHTKHIFQKLNVSSHNQIKEQAVDLLKKE